MTSNSRKLLKYETARQEGKMSLSNDLFHHSPYLHMQNFSYFSFFLDLHRSHWLVTMLETLVLVSIFLVSVVANIGALVLVSQEKRLADSTLFTLNLFLADLLFISTVPFVIAVRWSGAWYLGSVACQIMMYIITLSGSVTITTLGAISVDRLVAILKMETTPNPNPRWAPAVLLVIWFSSAVELLPLFLFSRVVSVVSEEQQEMQICTLIWPHLIGEVAWNATFIILGFLLPGASIVISYSKIIQIRRGSKRRVQSTTSQSLGRGEHPCPVSKQDYRLFRTLLILMISFFIMWTPIFIVTFLILVRNFQVDFPISSSMFFWVMTFTMANSALNPVLYSLYQLRGSWKQVCCAVKGSPGQRDDSQRIRHIYN